MDYSGGVSPSYFSLYVMRYFYKKPEEYKVEHGKIYTSNHPVYSRCTLYSDDEGRGLAVIQQRFDKATKCTYWTEIDPWLVDDIFNQERFKEYFNRMAKHKKKGLWPTVSLRQIMWALKMKPIKRERWETVFDRKTV